MRALVLLVALLLSTTLGAQQPQSPDQVTRILDRSLPPLTPTAVAPVVGAVNVPLTLADIRYEALNGSRCEVYLNTANTFPTSVRFYNGPCTGVAAIPPAFSGQIKPGLRVYAHVKSFNTNRGNNPATLTWSFTFESGACTPVNCVEGTWGPWVPTGDGSWSACGGTPPTQTRQEQQTRTGDIPATCGGAACSATTQTRTATQACSIPVCTYVLDYTSYNYPSAGGTHRTTVTTQDGCAWSATTDSPAWLTIDSGLTGTGTGTVVGTVHMNTGPARVGNLTIGGQRFTANQAAGGVPPAATLTVAPTTFVQATPLPLVVTWNNPNPTAGDWLGIYRWDETTYNFQMGDNRWMYLDCTQRAVGIMAVPAGSCGMNVSGLPPERWRVQLHSNEGFVELARAEFIVVAGTPPVMVDSVPSNELVLTPATGQTSATIAWDAPLTGTASGYKVHVGKASKVYDSFVDVGNVLSFSGPVAAGQTYYMVVTAYAPAGAPVSAPVAGPPKP